MAGKRILVVLTSHNKLGDTGKPTGWYLPELAHPFFVFQQAGCKMTLASIKGGEAPCDPGSLNLEDADNKKFWETPALKALAQKTKKLSECKSADYDAVFYVGGFGTMWDFPDDADVQRLSAEIWERGGVVSAVCHGPVALVNVKLADGSLLVKGRRVTAFCNEEEDAVQCRSVVPYTVEDKMNERGALFSKGGVFEAYTQTDGRLITGQNPPSAKATAEAIVKALSSNTAPIDNNKC